MELYTQPLHSPYRLGNHGPDQLLVLHEIILAKHLYYTFILHIFTTGIYYTFILHTYTAYFYYIPLLHISTTQLYCTFLPQISTTHFYYTFIQHIVNSSNGEAGCNPTRRLCERVWVCEIRFVEAAEHCWSPSRDRPHTQFTYTSPNLPGLGLITEITC